jgi:hypothetical protein
MAELQQLQLHTVTAVIHFLNQKIRIDTILSRFCVWTYKDRKHIITIILYRKSSNELSLGGFLAK